MSHTQWKVSGGKLQLADFQMEAGCHHTDTARRACGGCYARLNRALEQIQAEPEKAVEICRSVFAAMKLEGGQGAETVEG